MKFGKQPSCCQQKWLLLAAPLVLLVVAAKLLNQNPPVNVAQTSPDHEDTSLRSRFYTAPWNEVVSAVHDALVAQHTYGRAWKLGQSSISGAEPGAHLVEVLRAEVPVLVFTDDFEVTLREEEGGRVRVDCHSASRIGKGDFGENRRHVLQFLAALDERLGG